MRDNRSQRTSKCGKNVSDTVGYRLVCHFLVLTIFWRHSDQLLNKHMATRNLFFKVTRNLYVSVCCNAHSVLTFLYYNYNVNRLGESPFMLSSFEHLKELENILIIFTRKTVLNRMCPRPIWFSRGGFNVVYVYKRRKNGCSYTKASLTKIDQQQLETNYFDWLTDWK